MHAGTLHIPSFLFAGGLALVLSSISACSNSSAPQPPALTQKADSAKAEGEQKDAADQTAADAPATESPAPPAFNAGGADIGGETDKAAVKKCLDGSKFYDRFAQDGTGACTSLALAKLDCTVDGIKAALPESKKAQFTAALAGDYAGWVLDQCLDCPPTGTPNQCHSQTGSAEVGTRVFFVKDKSAALKGKALLLPIRPGQETPPMKESASGLVE